MVEVMPNLGHALTLGEEYLKSRCPLVVGISLGNPYFWKSENLKRLFRFAKNSSEKILIFITDKISEHNYRAVSSRNPERSARIQANQLRNKCKKAALEVGLSDTMYSLVNWVEEIEPDPAYVDALLNIKDLFKNNDEFRFDVQKSTAAVLRCMQNRGKNEGGEVKGDCSTAEGKDFDIEEGVKYLLKELAFFSSISNIYKSYDKVALVYHRSWPLFEKYVGGLYDNEVRSGLGFVIFK